MNSKLRSLLEIQVGMPCIYESQNEARAEDKNLDILCIAIVFKTGIEWGHPQRVYRSIKISIFVISEKKIAG